MCVQQGVTMKGSAHDVINNLLRQITLQLKRGIEEKDRNCYGKWNSERIQRKRIHIP